MKLLLLLLYCLLASADPIRFAPLPMDIAPKLHQQYSHLLAYLSRETDLEFEFVYCANYDEIIKKFKANEIDIAELGPLPFVELYRHAPYAEPFLTFLTKEGQAHYTCKLITSDAGIAALDDVTAGHHFYLTSTHSTCGTLMTQRILRKAGKNLNDYAHTYVGPHSAVVLEILLNYNSVGGVKSTVSDNYMHLGIKVLDVSDPIPGFAFVANTKTIGTRVLAQVKQAILKLEPLKRSEDWALTRKWGKNIRYGAVITDRDSYDTVIKAVEQMDHE